MISLKQDLDFVDKITVRGVQETDVSLTATASAYLNLQTNAAKEFLRIAMANALLMDRKQIDYGPRNISSFGTPGVVIRMNDKMERLKTLYKGGRRRKSQNESLMDSFRDISNYGIIAMMLELDRWPNE